MLHLEVVSFSETSLCVAIETEENYVQVLRTVSENFIKNMQTGLMNRETINTIFINIEVSRKTVRGC